MLVSECEGKRESSKNRGHIPQCIDSHRLHEVLRVAVQDAGVGDADSGIGEEDVKAAIEFQGLVNDTRDIALIAGVNLARVDLDARVQLVDLALVRVEMVGV